MVIAGECSRQVELVEFLVLDTLYPIWMVDKLIGIIIYPVCPVSPVTVWYRYLTLSALINLQHPSTSTSPLLQTTFYTTWQNPNPVQQISPLQQKNSNKSVSPGYPIQLLRYQVLIETKQPSAQGELATAVDDLLDQLKHKFDVVSGEMFSKCASLRFSISVIYTLFYALCSVLYHAIPGSS